MSSDKKQVGIIFLLLYAFFAIFIQFVYHGAASEIGDTQYNELLKLYDDATKKGIHDIALQYEIRAKSWFWATQDNYNSKDGIVSGVIGGVALVPLIYVIYLRCELISKRQNADIWNPLLFLFCTLSLGAYFLVYEIVAWLTDYHLTYSPVDLTIGFAYSTLLLGMIYLHLMLARRKESFEKAKSAVQKEKNCSDYGKSIDLENKTWTQILQSAVFSTMLLLGSVLITLLTNTTELKDLFALHNAVFFVTYQIVVVILFFTGIFFGIFMRILLYLGNLSDILKNT